MSFKRDADDAELLAVLKRQRVAELLAFHIPDDEAMLLKNGRYSCVVCPHRPIFDTIDMMAIHRKGAKHLSNLSRLLERKESKNLLILKRKQEQYLKTGNSNPCSVANRSASTVSSLLKATPYNSCSKRRKRPTDRKQTLDTGQSKVVYGRTAVPTAELCTSAIPRRQLGESLVRSYINDLKNKKSFESKVTESRQMLATAASSQEHSCDKQHQESTSSAMPVESSSMTDEQLKRASYYLNLRREGWKKTLDGQWVKDEEAEFDSDENPPQDY